MPREDAPTKRVLTVDDSSPMRAILRSMLRADDSYLVKPFTAWGPMAAVHVLLSLKRRIPS